MVAYINEGEDEEAIPSDPGIVTRRVADVMNNQTMFNDLEIPNLIVYSALTCTLVKSCFSSNC